MTNVTFDIQAHEVIVKAWFEWIHSQSPRLCESAFDKNRPKQWDSCRGSAARKREYLPHIRNNERQR